MKRSRALIPALAAVALALTACSSTESGSDASASAVPAPSVSATSAPAPSAPSSSGSGSSTSRDEKSFFGTWVDTTKRYKLLLAPGGQCALTLAIENPSAQPGCHWSLDDILVKLNLGNGDELGLVTDDGAIAFKSAENGQQKVLIFLKQKG